MFSSSAQRARRKYILRGANIDMNSEQVKLADALQRDLSALQADYGKTVGELRAALAESEHKGWCDALRNIEASVAGYPNAGGDMGIMTAITNLLKRARAEALEEAAKSIEKRAANWTEWGELGATPASADIRAELLNEAIEVRALAAQPSAQG